MGVACSSSSAPDRLKYGDEINSLWPNTDVDQCICEYHCSESTRLRAASSSTDPKKKDWLAILVWPRRDQRSEDYESETYKHIRAIDVLSILLQTEASQKSGLTKMTVVNFVASKMKQKKLDPVFFLDQCSPVGNIRYFWKLRRWLVVVLKRDLQLFSLLSKRLDSLLTYWF